MRTPWTAGLGTEGARLICSAPPKKAYTQSHSNHRRTPGEGLPKTLSGLYLPRLEFRFGSKSTFFVVFLVMFFFFRHALYFVCFLVKWF